MEKPLEIDLLNEAEKNVSAVEWKSRKKEEARFKLAKGILWLVAVCMLLPLFAIVVFAFFAPANLEILKVSLVEVLEELIKIVSIAFGPLLAFILGYYFSGN